MKLTAEPVLKVENFSKSFILHEQGVVIPSSHGVNLEAFSGRLTALIGPTGAGKSTVLKGVYRTYLPDSGNILYRTSSENVVNLAHIDEHEILKLRKTEISFVTQFLHVLPRQAAEDVVAQPLYYQGIAREEGRARAREMLRAVNLPKRLWGISPSIFSGGEKQRVNLARGLVAKPRLLLLDEPTASLDPRTTDLVIDLIQGVKKKGIAIVAILHDPELVDRLADDVVELTPPNGNGNGNGNGFAVKEVA